MVLFSGRKAPLFGYALASLLGLAGCSTEVPYQNPMFPFLASYSPADRAVPVLLDNSEWWKGFNDATLNTLVERALADNLDMELAKERVIEARANLESVPLLGSITPSASVVRRREHGGPDETRAEGALGLSWMLDPYGSRRQQVNAAGARVDVAGAEVDAARLLLIFNMSNAYVDLRYNQRILALRREQLRSRRQTVALTRRLFDRQSATRLDVVRTEALVAQTQALIPAIVAAITGRKNEIAVLAGTQPGTLDIDLDRRARQLRPGMSAEVGIPADLLRNRPDIRIAERLYYASVAEIGVAKADLFPRLSLGGSIGVVSIDGNSGGEYFFGPTIQFPSLLNSDRRATVQARHSQARQAHTSWKSTVLEAVSEVENALASYSASSASVQAAQRGARLNREAADLTRDLVERDVATIRDLVDAEEEIADADVVLADNIRLLGRNFITLNVSLGSGNSVGERTESNENVTTTEGVDQE